MNRVHRREFIKRFGLSAASLPFLIAVAEPWISQPGASATTPRDHV